MVFIPKSSSDFEMGMFLNWFKSLRGKKIIHAINSRSSIKCRLYDGMTYVIDRYGREQCMPLYTMRLLHGQDDLKIQDISEL